MATFRELDGLGDQLESGGWPLEEWYAAVRDLSLEDLSLGDVCRACRQNLFLEHILPIALKRLRDDSAASELYDGELGSALARIPSKLWSNHPQLAEKTKRVLSDALSEFDPDVVEEIKLFIQNSE